MFKIKKIFQCFTERSLRKFIGIYFIYFILESLKCF